jgi:hypothetical protein
MSGISTSVMEVADKSECEDGTQQSATKSRRHAVRVIQRILAYLCILAVLAGIAVGIWSQLSQNLKNKQKMLDQ